ncbi:MAG: tripartite tricarboxylate transporter permease [Sulfitobacter sp.]
MHLLSTALPALKDAFGMILQVHVIGYLVLGVCMGLAIGVFPGLGGIAGLSLLLPFMFGMGPLIGLALMVGMVAVAPTSDTFASVLMGIPGASASQATVLDGFPMAKKGQAARALSAAFAAFQSRRDIMDLVALFSIGFLGILMRRFDWSRPAFLIGFVLSNPAETYANQAVQIASSRFRKGLSEGLEYVFSPIVIVLIIITVLSVVIGLRQAKNIMAEGEVQSGSKRAPLVFLLVVIAYIAASYWNAALIPDYSSADRVFPIFVATIFLIGVVILFI